MARCWWSRSVGFAALAAVAALAGCRTAPPVQAPTPTAWEVVRPALQARDHFELKGRVAVAAAGEGFNARLRWDQTGTQSHVALEGPLGAGGVQITSDGSRLSIVNSKGERLDSEAARTELVARLGFEPPLSSLRYWILGVPDPGQPAQETLDSQQRLQSLQQDGWRIDYGAYMPVNGGWLPSRMTLQKSGVRVRLVVDGWNT